MWSGHRALEGDLEAVHPAGTYPPFTSADVMALTIQPFRASSFRISSSLSAESLPPTTLSEALNDFGLQGHSGEARRFAIQVRLVNSVETRARSSESMISGSRSLNWSSAAISRTAARTGPTAYASIS